MSQLRSLGQDLGSSPSSSMYELWGLGQVTFPLSWPRFHQENGDYNTLQYPS